MGTQDGIPTTSGPSRGPAIGERSAVRFPLCQAVLVTSCNSMDKPYVHFSKRLSKVRLLPLLTLLEFHLRLWLGEHYCLNAVLVTPPSYPLTQYRQQLSSRIAQRKCQEQPFSVLLSN